MKDAKGTIKWLVEKNTLENKPSIGKNFSSIKIWLIVFTTLQQINPVLHLYLF